eukprot:gene8861-11954_t
MLLCVIESFIVPQLLQNAMSNILTHKLSTITLMALNNQAIEKIKEYKSKYSSLINTSNLNDIEQEQMKEIKVIIDSFEALESIEKDLLLFEEQMNGDDQSLKETAIIFTNEFINVRNELENKLNEMLT